MIYDNCNAEYNDTNKQVCSLNCKEIDSNSIIDKLNQIQRNMNEKKSNIPLNVLKTRFTHSLVLGKIGELYTAKKFIEHGYEVYAPYVDTKGVDFIVRKK